MSNVPQWMMLVLLVVWCIGGVWAFYTLFIVPHRLNEKIDNLLYRVEWLQDAELGKERDKMMGRGDYARDAIPRPKKGKRS
jgi:hypothetical protein